MVENASSASNVAAEHPYEYQTNMSKLRKFQEYPIKLSKHSNGQ